MLTLKEKGLKVQICSFTGNVFLTYHYPIAKKHYGTMSEIAKLHNCSIDTIKGNTYLVYTSAGNSNAVFSEFRTVQKHLMLQSREAKIADLQQEIVNLKEGF